MTRDMVESAWVDMRYILHHLDLNMRKETRRLVLLHMKIIRKNILWSTTKPV